MANLFIRGCDVLHLKDGQPQIAVQQDIDIRGRKIHAIGRDLSVPEDVQTQVIEGQGLLAIPGLMNTHAHVPMVLFRGMVEDVSVQSWFNDYVFPLESNLTPEDVYWGALLGMAEMIENGVTSVADHYFYMDEVAKAAQTAGMRANLVWAVFGHQGEAQLDETCRFIERWQGKADGRITTWLGPHAPYTTGPDFLRLSAVRAKALKVGIHIHVSETSEQVMLSLKQHGITPVKMLAETGVLDVPTILGHCLYPTDEDVQILSEVKAGVAHAPKTYLKLGMGIITLRQLREAGVPVGLATDGAGSSNTLDILEQLRIMALVQKHTYEDPTVMPVGEALQIAFEGSAEVLQMGDSLGALAPGRLADITLLRQDGVHVFPRFNPAANLVYSSRASDVDTVICNGEVLMQHRKLLTIDKEQVKKEISARLERLSQRTPGQRIAVYPA
jgi:5-methylthioadenosine/S-adenosylhomocysteine deaminase